MRYFFAGAAIMVGVWIISLVFKSSMRFERFCERLAAIRGEENELKSDLDKQSDGYGPYQMEVWRELMKPSRLDFIPTELEAEAAELGHRMVLARDLWVVYLVVIGAVILFAGL